jgi:hypothetical protein
VRPVLARPAEAPQGAIGLLTLTGYHGYHGVLQGNHGVLTGYYKVAQVCRMGAQGGARSGTRLDGCARPPCVGSRAAAKARKKCSGYSTVRLGTHRVLTTCNRLGVHCLLHQAEGGTNLRTMSKKHVFTNVHTCGVSVTANALAAIPTTRAPTYAPDGAPPWPLRWVGPAGGPRSAAAYAAMAVPHSLAHGKRR